MCMVCKHVYTYMCVACVCGHDTWSLCFYSGVRTHKISLTRVSCCTLTQGKMTHTGFWLPHAYCQEEDPNAWASWGPWKPRFAPSDLQPSQWPWLACVRGRGLLFEPSHFRQDSIWHGVRKWMLWKFLLFDTTPPGLSPHASAKVLHSKEAYITHRTWAHLSQKGVGGSCWMLHSLGNDAQFPRLLDTSDWPGWGTLLQGRFSSSPGQVAGEPVQM